MKPFTLLAFVMLLFTSCQNKDSNRYTQDSEEIEIVKATINDYDYHKWDALSSRYADSAQIFYNSRKDILNPKDLKAYHESNDKSFLTRAFEDEYREYEMIENDDGKRWVNFWGLWIGHLEANNKEIVIPVHITYQFDNGKIIKEYGYWNTSELVLELQKLEAEEDANFDPDSISEEVDDL